MDKNNIDKNFYSEKSLYLLNIKELRALGRKFGVPSPTTMKKQDLVAYILKVVYGEIEPPIRSSIGRPTAAQEFDINCYIDKIKKNTEMSERLKEVSLGMDAFEFPSFKASAPKDEFNTGEIVQRVVFASDSGWSLRKWRFVESDGDIPISKEVATALGLENFDVVEVISTDSGVKIVSINGKTITKNIKPFEINSEIVGAGSRKVFYIRTKEKIEEEIEKIKQNAKSQGLKLVYFGANNCGEGAFFKFSGIAGAGAFKDFMAFVQHIKKLVYENQDVVAVVEDMLAVEAIFSSLDEEVSARAKAALAAEVCDFVKLGNILLTFHKLETLNYFN